MNKHLAVTVLLAALPLAGHAGMNPAVASSTAPATVMPHMHDMDHATTPSAHAGHGNKSRQLDHATTANSRDPDYSDGIAPSHMPGMDMAGDEPVGMLQFTQFEAFGGDGSGQRWELTGWYGLDLNRFTVRSEGQHASGGGSEGDLELLWSHAVAPFWNAELGARHDFGQGPTRDWLALGIAGLAPYVFDLRATLYLGTGGRSALRLSAGYELRITQRLTLEPEIEANLYGKAAPLRGIDSGLDSIEGGLRLRYAFRPEFAPYLGVTWEHADGATDRQWVAGLRFWF